ncbi:MAG: AAA family ATPase [Pseudonocardia sp.]|nr:AAA family ATPase [Pseudonocardia sp.]
MNESGTIREIPRFVRASAQEALTDTRVVGVVGPRQAGKSTLVLDIIAGTPNARYVSLDDIATRTAALADPAGFVAGRPGLLAIDEVQRVPDLLLAIKASVDRDQRPGRFLLTGSSQLSANRGVAETLTGRIERMTLWPFSQDELAGRRSQFLNLLLSGELPDMYSSSLSKGDYLERARSGGFPEGPTSSDQRAAVSRRAGGGISHCPDTGLVAEPHTTGDPRAQNLYH